VIMACDVYHVVISVDRDMQRPRTRASLRHDGAMLAAATSAGRKLSWLSAFTAIRG